MTALVLGSDTPIGLAVIRELGGHGVQVHAVGRGGVSIGGASRFAHAEYARPGGPIADWLPDLIAKSGARALLAISETDLIELAALPEVIGGCRILTPRAEPLAKVLDKSITLALGRSVGIDVSASWQPVKGEDFGVRARTMTYPVVLKWADPPAVIPILEKHAVAFLKAEFVMDPTALVAALGQYDGVGRWPLVQDYCPGVGIGQMIYMAKGTAVMRFQHQRLHEWPPEGGVSTLCEGTPLNEHAGQMLKSEALLQKIGWEGPAMVEYRHDPATGRYWLMEVNGRFWGSLPLASASGATFAWEQYRRDILGQTDIAGPPRSGLRARYMIPETRRLLRLLFQRSAIADPQFRARPGRDLFDYATGFLRPDTRYYVWRLDDPGPLWRDVCNIFRKLWRRGRG
ncbi:MAG: ATP-grasp domain protein [Sphingomonadales bacterium]|nr:ATP-grasp domain protein [Sphingomonadales bacterium]